MNRARFLARALEQEARQLRGYFVFSSSIKRQQEWTQLERPNDPYLQTALLDVNHIAFDGEQGRRIHALVNLLTRGGYRVWMKPRLCFFQTAKKFYKWRALAQVYVCGDAVTPAQFDLCITDRRSECPVALRTLRLTSDTNRQLRNEELPIPYSMHPDHLDNREDLRLDQYRETDRRWLAFFGGFCRGHDYRPSAEHTHFNTIDRRRVVQLAEESFANETNFPDNQDNLESLMSRDFNGLVVLDSSLHRVATNKWLSILSRAKFFLAAPGVTYPTSHNCIESFAVGTIPILEYPEAFQPALEHGVNCVVFRGEQGFLKRMGEIKVMPESEIEAMRRRAAAYYDEHLSPTSFTSKLSNSSFSQLHMFAHLVRPNIASTTLVA